MSSNIAFTNPYGLKLTSPIPLTEYPAIVYLNGLSEGSRPTMARSLKAIALMLTSGNCDLYTLDWSKLRYKHTAAIQAALLDKYEATTAKKMKKQKEMRYKICSFNCNLKDKMALF